MSDETKDRPGEDEAVDEAAGEAAESAAGSEGGQSEGAQSEGAQSEASADAPAESEAAEASEPAEAEAGPGEGEGEETSGEDDEAKAAAEAEEKAKAAAAAKAKAEAAAKAKAEHEAREAAKPPWERDPVAPEWEDADGDPLVATIRERHPDAIESARTLAGDLTLLVKTGEIAAVAATLKAEGFVLPVDVCGAHYPDRESGRFEVVYHLYSFDANRRIRLKVEANEDETVPSVTPIWVGANWPEREAYDMYGIRFEGHPDMTRILLWEGFNGYPLRKDFPVEGIDTGSAIYPEYYEDDAGPVAGTGTGWKPPEPPEPEPEPEAEAEAETPPADA